MVEEYQRRRTARIRKRRNKTVTRLSIAGALVVLLAIAGYIGLTPLELGQKGAKKATVVKVGKDEVKDDTEKDVAAQRTLILMGVDESDGVRTLTGVAQVVFDPARNRVGGVTISPDVFITIPGRGLNRIKDGFSEGSKKTSDAIAALTGVDAEGYIEISGPAFSSMIETKEIGDQIAGVLGGNIEDAKALGERISLIPVDRITLVELPVKPIDIGEETYLDPDRDDLVRLVKSIWGREPAKRKQPVRVIILNGNGTPGVGRRAADRLVGEGFRIVDVKNADHFDYQETEVLAYTARGKGAAAGLVKQLELGIVIDKPLAQDVTDLVVVVGKDFD